MRCYYHSHSDAVGLCRNCAKGLCPECAVEVSQILACKSRCEKAVQSINQMMQSQSGYGKMFNVIFYLLLGLVILIFSIDKRNISATRFILSCWGFVMVINYSWAIVRMICANRKVSWIKMK